MPESFRRWRFTVPFTVGLFAAAACLAQDLSVLDPARHPHPERMLSSYLQAIAAQQLEARRADLGAITSKEVYDQRKARIRAAATRMVGGLAEKRNPLNAKVTGSLDREDYRVEKVVYESRPRFFVTANLYIPKTGRAPYPAVLQPVGHSTSAKNRAFYQRIAIALVKTGFVVLTYDPIGQGERRVFWDQDLSDSKVGSTTVEHSMVGWQSLLGGESVARFRIWDGMRSIDYLLSRSEVDGSKIGVTGCSGGGTLTTYIAALDDRVQAAAPACYISDWEDQLKGTGPQDAEQQFPDQLLEGLNHADWVGLAAPKPYLIVSTDQDFFPLEGARKTYEEMKRVYALYDAASKIQWFHEPGGHGVPDASRNEICKWMSQWLRGEAVEVDHGEIRTEYEEDLNATPTGQVATSLGGETASTWNMERFRDRVPARKVLSSPNDIAELRQKLRIEIARLTRYRPSSAPLNVQQGRMIYHDGYRVEAITYQSDNGLTIPALLCGTGSEIAIYLDPRGKANAVRAEGDISQLVDLGFTVLAIDVSGVGEVEFRRHAAAPWSFPPVVSLGLMVGRPFMGIRIDDVIRGLDALEALGKRPAGGSGVAGFAQGKLGTVLLHAAVMDDRLSSVAVEQNLLSYRLVGASPIHRDLEDTIIPGVLGRYDLPDLAAALAPRPVSILNSVSPTGRVLLRKDVEAEYGYASEAYEATNAAGQFRIGLRREAEPLAQAHSLQ
jgi:dienelactone hydrolase